MGAGQATRVLRPGQCFKDKVAAGPVPPTTRSTPPPTFVRTVPVAIVEKKAVIAEA